MLRPQGDVASSRKAPRPQHRAARSLAPPDPVIAPPAGLAARGRGRGAFLPRDSGAWLVPAQTCGQQIRGGRPRVPRERLSVTRPTSGGGGAGQAQRHAGADRRPGPRLGSGPRTAGGGGRGGPGCGGGARGRAPTRLAVMLFFRASTASMRLLMCSRDSVSCCRACSWTLQGAGGGAVNPGHLLRAAPPGRGHARPPGRGLKVPP